MTPIRDLLVKLDRRWPLGRDHTIAVLALMGVVASTCGERDAKRKLGAAEVESVSSEIADTLSVEYSRDIAPIIFKHCTPCHRPGQPAPFSLLTYEDAKTRAPLILQATARGSMPPWLPERGEFAFAGERRLSPDEIRRIQLWVGSGAREGDPTQLPPMPDWGVDWSLGDPDLTLTMPEPFLIPAEGKEIFRNFVVPVSESAQRCVRSFELRPGGSGAAHHAQIFADATGSARRLDEEDPLPGFDGMVHVGGAREPDGFFLGWTPGKVPFAGFDDLCWRLEPGTDLVLMLHMRPTGSEEEVQAEIGLHYAPQPAQRFPAVVRLSVPNLDIPAGERDHVVEDEYVLPVDVNVLSIYPHAHYLGKRIEGQAVFPDGSRRSLIRIENWDFSWQDEYRYLQPVFLPRGTKLTMRFSFDNSDANPRNPNDPPARVVYGPRSTDEMAELLIQVLPHDAVARAVLVEDLERKNLRSRVALFEHLVRVDPRDAASHYDLAISLQSQGKLKEAVRHYRRAIEVQPQYGEAHNNLGTALQAMGRLEEAVQHYQVALEIDADNIQAQSNLGLALQLTGQVARSLVYYRTALQLDRKDAAAHARLGYALAELGRLAEALDHFRAASGLQPDWVAALFATAWTLTTSPDSSLRDPEEARRLAERASEVSEGTDPMVLDGPRRGIRGAGAIRERHRDSRGSARPRAGKRRR